MESTSWLDVVIKRLRFFTRPLPLASTIGALLLGVFIWDYLRHPEWFGAFEDESAGPNEELDLSGLTPEEQAAATDLDNLTLLLNELGVEAGNNPQTQVLPTGDATAQNSFLNETLALSQPNAASAQLGDSPFSGYLQQYEFGRNSLRINSGASSAGSQFGGVNFNYFGRTNRDTTATSDQPINPLAEALSNQAGLAGAVQTQEDSPLANELRSQSDPNQVVSQETADGTTQDTLPPGEFSSQTVTIPGVDFPVLPTLPQMSPPPGTTGYTAPATLDLMPPLPGSSSSSPAAFPGAASPLPSTGVSGVTAGTGLPSTSSSDIDVSNGFVTPYTPVVPTVTPAQSATPQPFTAPRPPGTYTGGGYINTFSNPSGPSSTAPNGN
ncbi:MAG: hypothetical protein F6K00_01935 [Leptolyngbya sp. SIOISBB]|nr:hypothetical protein [Leptolyngbya sp. SIOISBB]